MDFTEHARSVSRKPEVIAIMPGRLSAFVAARLPHVIDNDVGLTIPILGKIESRLGRVPIRGLHGFRATICMSNGVIIRELDEHSMAAKSCES